jgi:hypothetical protein
LSARVDGVAVPRVDGAADDAVTAVDDDDCVVADPVAPCFPDPQALRATTAATATSTRTRVVTVLS